MLGLRLFLEELAAALRLGESSLLSVLESGVVSAVMVRDVTRVFIESLDLMSAR